MLASLRAPVGAAEDPEYHIRAACGGSLKRRSRSHGNSRKHFYGCSGYHDRGRTVCTNQADVPMSDADDIVIEALLDDILDPSMVRDAVDVALELLQRDDSQDRLARLDADLEVLNQERARLAAAIATGGELSALLDALKVRDNGIDWKSIAPQWQPRRLCGPQTRRGSDRKCWRWRVLGVRYWWQARPTHGRS
jgi:hypothetical protein